MHSCLQLQLIYLVMVWIGMQRKLKGTLFLPQKMEVQLPSTPWLCVFLSSKHRKNRKLGMLWLIRAAKQGNANAEAELGRQFYLGKNIAKSRDKALKWLSQAVNQDNVRAQYWLGRYYQHYAKSKDNDQAFYWYLKAAQAGYPAAQYQMAMQYLKLKDNASNQHKAFLWMLNAALEGERAAQHQLVKLYTAGIGVEKKSRVGKAVEIACKGEI